MSESKQKSLCPTNTGFSRRDLFRTAGLAAGGAMLLGLPRFLDNLVPEAAAAIDTRISAGMLMALEIEGQFVDHLRSIEGGFPKGDIVSNGSASSNIVKKHMAGAKMQDIVIQCDPLMPKSLFDWIAATLARQSMRRNGALLTADMNLTEQSRLQFNNALLSEFTIPPLDTASKEPVFFTVKIAPETTAAQAGKGLKLPAFSPSKSKAVIASNFRLSIPGLDCSHVVRIEELTFKQSIAPDQLGMSREQILHPAKLEYPNLTVLLPEAFAGTFYGWYQDMVLKGNVGEQSEKMATLELMDQAFRTPLLTVTFTHLGIFGFSPQRYVAGSETPRMVKVEMYCEQMLISAAKA